MMSSRVDKGSCANHPFIGKACCNMPTKDIEAMEGQHHGEAMPFKYRSMRFIQILNLLIILSNWIFIRPHSNHKIQCRRTSTENRLRGSSMGFMVFLRRTAFSRTLQSRNIPSRPSRILLQSHRPSILENIFLSRKPLLLSLPMSNS